MTSHLGKNLWCFEERDPVLKERLQWPSPDEYDLEFVGEGPMQSLRRRTVDGQWHLLHSTRDPEKEGNRWAEGKIPSEPVYNLIVLGAGMWYHLWSLVYRVQDTLENLIIIEQSEAVIRKAFEARDLTQILSNEHVHLLVNPKPEEIRGIVNKLLTTLSLDGVLVTEHEPSIECAPGFYAKAKQTVDETLEAGKILLRTKERAGGLIQENLLRNLPTMFSTPSSTLFQGILQGIPGFIVAAGPSLDRNKNELQHIQNRGAVITVDTSYPILRKAGIPSHISVTVDPTDYNLAHFRDFPEMDDTLLFYAPSLHWEVLERVQANWISLPMPFSKTLNLFPTSFGIPLYLKTGLNVAQTAFSLACFLGCDPIVFVGLDLSFGRTGGGTHAEGAALRRNITLSSQPGRMIVELLGDGAKEEEFEPMFVPSNEGSEVPTSTFWLAYLRSIEQDIAESSVRCINATEGGAKIEGTEIMSLSEAIQQVCYVQHDIAERLKGMTSSFVAPDPSELARFWESAEEVLTIGMEKAKEGRRAISDIEAQLAQGDPPLSECERLTQKVSEIHREMIQDQKLYSYLDEAADRVLSPFLRKSARPRGSQVDPSSLRKNVERYAPFFQGMEEVCSHYLAVVQEMAAKTPKVDDLGFDGPIVF
ncbi:MAG: 6-hydroxymethylpterin diphosphokinase MptE-like protein [bacterium]